MVDLAISGMLALPGMPRPGPFVRCWAQAYAVFTALRQHLGGARRTGVHTVAANVDTSAEIAAQERHDSHAAGRFQDVVMPHLDAAYNLARFLTRDGDAAQDIVHDAFLRAFRGFDGYRGGDPRAWLLAIVRNCVRAWAGNRSREQARRAHPTDAGTEDGEESALDQFWDPDQETPESALLRRDEAQAVRALLETLPEAYREVLVLRELEELSYQQIAKIAAVPIGTVMSRLARARQLFGAAWQRLTELKGQQP